MNLKSSAVILLSLSLITASACASGGGTDMTSSVQPAEPVSLRPGDVLQVTVWPNEMLGGEFQIEDTGNAYLPLLGEIRAAGVPLDELRADLRRMYGEAMQNPVVTIRPVFTVGVTGAVRSPGLYPVDPSQGIFDIIGMAGGFASNANEDDVRIVREGQVVEIDAARALEEGTGAVAVSIRPGDQIVVPETRITFRDGLSILNTAVTIGLLIERLVN